MTAPSWVDSVVGEFGQSAGLGRISLGDKGVAALSFQNGLALHLEHAFDSLFVTMTVPTRLDAASAARLLGYAHPDAHFAFRLRTGYIAKSGRAVFAVKIADRDVTLNVSRTTEPLRFDTGIGQAGYAEILDSPVAGQPQKSLLPGSTTVTQAIDEIFPTDRSVGGEVMRALVAGNSAVMRTPSGFSQAAHSALRALKERDSAAADEAAVEIEMLLADTDLLDRYRMALLET